MTKNKKYCLDLKGLVVSRVLENAGIRCLDERVFTS